MPEIILKNVSKSFGKTVAVEELNLQILDNSFVTLLGPSGCGKTTILRMIAGLETPTEGKISIGGRVVFDSERGISLAPDKRNVGFLFQNYALWPHMTVYQNIAFGLENMRWDRDRIKKRVDELLRMLRIEQYVSRYPSELSGGQQQRVAIARTLAPGPEVLFMDEPLSNLDAKLRMEMRTELKRLHRDTKSTFVYVTHDQQEAMTLSTMVCVIEKGRLQQYAPPLPMYKNPANLFVAEFLLYATRGEQQNEALFQYVENGILWLDGQSRSFANFHLVFMMRLSRFIGFFPNLDDYHDGDCFDLRNGTFVAIRPSHADVVEPAEAERINTLMRMGFESMHLFQMNRHERNRIAEFILTYYRLHVPGFPELKSIEILKELFEF